MLEIEDLKDWLKGRNFCAPNCVKEASTRSCLNKKEKKYIPERGGKTKK